MDRMHMVPITPAPPWSPSGSESTYNVSPVKQEGGYGAMGEPFKKKQKRNKPTLSCEECVERKTKVSLFH